MWKMSKKRITNLKFLAQSEIQSYSGFVVTYQYNGSEY